MKSKRTARSNRAVSYQSQGLFFVKGKKRVWGIIPERYLSTPFLDERIVLYRTILLLLRVRVLSCTVL